MKVIAIRNSFFNKNNILTELAIHKGSVYHVVNVIFKDRPQYFEDTGRLYPKGVRFFELLEQKGFHVEDMFMELPDDDTIEFEEIKTEMEKI